MANTTEPHVRVERLPFVPSEIHATIDGLGAEVRVGRVSIRGDVAVFRELRDAAASAVALLHAGNGD